MKGNHFPGLQDSWIEEPLIHGMLWIQDIFRKVALGKIPEVFLCSLKGNVQEDRPYHRQRHRWGFSPIFTNPLG